MAIVLDGTTGITTPDMTSDGGLTADGVSFASGAPANTLVTTSTGNVGIGLTPSSWGNNKALQMTGPSLWGSSGVSHLSTNTYYDGMNYKYIASNYVTDYYQLNGTHVWRTAASGTAGNNVTLSEAMRIDSSGNVGIGTSAGTARLYVLAADSAPSSSGNMTSGSVFTYSIGGVALNMGTSSGGYSYFNSAYANNAGVAAAYRWYQGATQSMTLDSSGNLLVNSTSTSYAVSGNSLRWVNGTALMCSRNTTADTNQIAFFNPNGVVGAINSNGSSTAYLTSSDYRLKENVQPMVGALEKVAALKPVTYKWKADGSDGQGFIAHELQTVVPDCVTGEKDAVDENGNHVYQGIDTSFLVATLTAAIQEQQAIIQTLTARIEALESK